MQASFTPQEQQEIDRLREKYGGVRDAQAIAADEGELPCVSCSAGSTPPPRQAGASSASGPAASNVEASVCAYCGGTGTLVEIYNHRRLENFCKECDGRGVRVFKNGVEVQPGAASGGRGGGALTSSAAAGPAGVVALHSGKAAAAAAADGSGSDSEEAPSERIAALQRDMHRIAAKAALYAKERLDTLALIQPPGSAAAPRDPEGRDAAARELVAQLDLQLERLELARCKKQAALDRLRGGGAAGGGGVTLADVIANEGLSS